MEKSAKELRDLSSFEFHLLNAVEHGAAQNFATPTHFQAAASLVRGS